MLFYKEQINKRDAELNAIREEIKWLRSGLLAVAQHQYCTSKDCCCHHEAKAIARTFLYKKEANI